MISPVLLLMLYIMSHTASYIIYTYISLCFSQPFFAGHVFVGHLYSRKCLALMEVVLWSSMAKCVAALALSPGELIRSSEASMMTAAADMLDLNQTNHSVAPQRYKWKRKKTDWSQKSSSSWWVKGCDRESIQKILTTWSKLWRDGQRELSTFFSLLLFKETSEIEIMISEFTVQLALI